MATTMPIELRPLVQVEEDQAETPKPMDARSHRRESTHAAVPLVGPIQQTFWAGILAAVTFIALGATIILAWKSRGIGTFLSSNPLEDATARLRIVRILAEIDTLLLTALVAMSGKLAAWAASSSRSGVSMPMWLAMNPLTGFLGLLKLLFWGKRSKVKSRRWHHGWIIVRYPQRSLLYLG